jgi:hypothetical protein
MGKVTNNLAKTFCKKWRGKWNSGNADTSCLSYLVNIYAYLVSSQSILSSKVRVLTEDFHGFTKYIQESNGIAP